MFLIPYYLIKGRTMSPNELAGAENGNFFIRERVRRVFEILAPGQCAYYPTTYKGTSQTTPWLLTVASHQVVTGKVKPSIHAAWLVVNPVRHILARNGVSLFSVLRLAINLAEKDGAPIRTFTS